MSFIGVGNDNVPAFDRRSPAVNGLAFALSGDQTPLIDIELAPGKGVVCDLQMVLHIDAAIKLRPWPDLAGEARLLVNTSSDEPAGLTIRTGCAGKAGIFNLEDYGSRIVCVRQAVLAAGPGIMVSGYSHYRNMRHGELELIQLEGRGWAFLRSCGDVQQLKLRPGQQRVIKSLSLTAMTATIDIDPADVDPLADTTDFVRLTGPGEAWLQSGSWPANCA